MYFSFEVTVLKQSFVPFGETCGQASCYMIQEMKERKLGIKIKDNKNTCVFTVFFYILFYS